MPEEKDEKKKAKPDKPPPEERTKITRHSVTIAGEVIPYTATAGTIFLRDEKDEPTAEVFYVAYTRDQGDASTRPVTFAFNGGPGSSAVWLHLGALGPRRVATSDAAPTPPPPHAIVDNEMSILDVTDLVFIDPVGTGWSRPLGETKAKTFHSLSGDVKSVAEVIQRWTSRNGRWNSPRYLAGESYGTTRAAALAGFLVDHGVMINGVILVSPALMFQTLIFETGNDLPFVLYLPAFAATAVYHGKVETDDLRSFLSEVEAYAVETYAPALMLGAALSADRRETIAARLAELTGVDAALWLRHDLRIDLSRFCRELLRETGEVVGRLDSRFRNILPLDSDDPGETDPALYFPYGPYTSAIQHYLRHDLAFEEERTYQVLSFAVNESWTWFEDEEKRFGFINVGTELRRAMVHNPHMKVLFLSGLYDLATTYFASMHTARHLGREPAIRSRIQEAFYDAGHMMYLHEPSRAKLRDDLVAHIVEPG